MRRLPLICYTLLIILVTSVYLPLLYEKVSFKKIEKTHSFYSPVSRDFIFKEKFVGAIPDEAEGFAVDHHTGISYRKADGTYLPRVAFEKHLPFIFYKNMEIWGLLPVNLNGLEFDKAAIKSQRRVMELKSRDIPDKAPIVRFWPLLESNPGQARLVFPEDRFRITDTAMVFINADTNSEDKILTQRFTRALEENGFVFPARSVNGKFTVLKPFDEGVFMVDSDYRVFHVKRVDGQPRVVKTNIPPSLKTRHIRISENKQKEFYGLLLSGDGKINLVSYDNYRLIPVPLDSFDPDRMDLKLIFNPLYVTAVYSDSQTIRAVAMDRNFSPVKTYVHSMSRAQPTMAARIHDFIFPFSLKLSTGETDEFIRFSMTPGTLISLGGTALCTLVFFGISVIGKGRRPDTGHLALVFLTGIYGLIAVSLVDPDQ
ncbi:MAG: DUF4857 domain-containing protein [Desulfobacterales bacterium]|nr:DUF4857 domain-containing protein [Desulfobacterales bacterium]